MPVPSTLAELSVNPSENSPLGSESPTTADNYFRAHAAFIKQVNEKSDTAVTDAAAAVAAAALVQGAADAAQSTANAASLTAGDAQTAAISAQNAASNAQTAANAAQTTADGLRSDLAATPGSSLVGFQQSGAGAVARTAQEKLRVLMTLDDYTSAEGAVNQAYVDGSMMLIKAGESAKLVCNPTAGDDFQAMCRWLAAGHFVEETGSLFMEVADGLHNLNTFVDLTQQKTLDIRGTAAPTFFTITGIAIAPISGTAYTATVTVSAALPDRVVPGFAVGCQNVKGDRGAESINGAQIVKTVAGDRLSFTFDYQAQGVVPTTPTTIDTTVTLGIEGSRVLVPMGCLRVQAGVVPGWDGSAREGFINVMGGSKLFMQNLGISYNGGATNHEILFARDAGSQINLVDRVMIAGTGLRILRLSGACEVYANRCCFGGALTGNEIIQGVFGSSAQLIRCSMGSGTASALTPTAGCNFNATQCVTAGFLQALRPTYGDASVNYLNGRIVFCGFAVSPTGGNVTIDSLSSIRNCEIPLQLAGGNIRGNPTISDNNVATVEAYRFVLGGAWYPANQNAFDSGFFKVGRYSTSLDFPSLPANSFADLTVAATGAVFDDFCTIQRAGSAEPAQGIVFTAFVSAPDQVTVRAYNITASAIDPTVFTGRVLLLRAT